PLAFRVRFASPQCSQSPTPSTVRFTNPVELVPEPLNEPVGSNPYTFRALSNVATYTFPFAIVGGTHFPQLPEESRAALLLLFQSSTATLDASKARKIPGLGFASARPLLE